MTFRKVGRLSATALLVAGLIGVAAHPALGAPAGKVDLALVTVVGEQVAIGTGMKPLSVRIENRGTAAPKKVFIEYVLDNNVTLGTAPKCELRSGNRIAVCPVEASQIPGPGRSSVVLASLGFANAAVTPYQPGSLGKITVTVYAEGDTDRTNDSRAIEVVRSANVGPDLVVTGSDVTGPGGTALRPGETGMVTARIVNHGDVPAMVQEIDAYLDGEGFSFVLPKAGNCTLLRSGRNIQCKPSSPVVLQPSEERKRLGSGPTGIEVRFSVTVAKNVQKTGIRTIGHLTVKGTNAVSDPRFPGKYLGGGGKDADMTDNRATFAVVVAEPAKPSQPAKPSGTPSAGVIDVARDNSPGDDGPKADPKSDSKAGPKVAAGGKGDGKLPVTGPVVTTVVAAGVLVMALGGILVVSARRRRFRLTVDE